MTCYFAKDKLEGTRTEKLSAAWDKDDGSLCFNFGDKAGERSNYTWWPVCYFFKPYLETQLL